MTAHTDAPQEKESAGSCKFKRFLQWSSKPVQDLACTITFRPSKFWVGEYVLTIVGAGGGAWVGVDGRPRELVILATSALVGVIIGAVIAGMAIQTAGFDRTFLRNLKAANKNPIKYLRPFLFTASAGVSSAIAILVWSAIPPTASETANGIIGGLSGSLAMLTLASVFPALNTLVAFIPLLSASAEIKTEEK
ncbi:hypothetical protein ABZ608_34115 [Streptomyces sp. NPDC013172]|uniref:hypothetical protein n=1 Tax=Streptomyces sp. NPDC013172 TaxID=3155009 RepID=UPI00340E8E84